MMLYFYFQQNKLDQHPENNWENWEYCNNKNLIISSAATPKMTLIIQLQSFLSDSAIKVSFVKPSTTEQKIFPLLFKLEPGLELPGA